ncbi:MAG: hypothetical protein U0271_02170 [Polyangiaceae bacterium]
MASADTSTVAVGSGVVTVADAEAELLAVPDDALDELETALALALAELFAEAELFPIAELADAEAAGFPELELELALALVRALDAGNASASIDGVRTTPKNKATSAANAAGIAIFERDTRILWL